MYLVETNAFSGYMRGGAANAKLRARIHSVPRSDIWVSSIAMEELIRGRLNVIRRELGSATKIGPAYGQLINLIKELSSFPMLPYDEAAVLKFQSWPKSITRIGSQDCRIAASAIVNDLIVITSDKDFSHIPEVRYEDWSR